MTEKILAVIAHFIVATISNTGYAGVAFLMAIESTCIPLPSEIIMPFSGYLVHTGRLTLIGVALAGALGCNIGSAIAYWIGAFGGRPFIARYGRFVLLDHRDLDRAEHFFAKYGSITVFVGRLLPVVRTFIALPAGIACRSCASTSTHFWARCRGASSWLTRV
jgi:membrane protein DedA with SNARE-associated domain